MVKTRYLEKIQCVGIDHVLLKGKAFEPDCLPPRENEGTERDAQGVGRDMSCPRKLFLDERKSGFRDVRRQHCLALRFLVKRENGDIRGWLVNIFIHHVFSKGN